MPIMAVNGAYAFHFDTSSVLRAASFVLGQYNLFYVVKLIWWYMYTKTFLCEKT